tara:strand:+ start:4512 stop:5450 length:939 start_codon:yes stop_codon:yes gene_type:complete
MAAILSGVNFDVNNDFVYTKAKVNANGRKSVGILNNENKKSLYLSTPLMLTWGVNEYKDEKTGEVQSYDIALQFPNDEYNNPDCVAFLKNMQALEQKVKDDTIANSKDWLNKTKLSSETVDALWSPMLKYPKDKETGEPDYSRAPTLKVKIPYWDGEFKNIELYNDSKELVFPTSEDTNIGEYIIKGSNVATIIQCGGIWVANGKFGVTWKLFQAVVKPKTTLSGKCHITLSEQDKEKMTKTIDEDEDEDVQVSHEVTKTQVDDSDEEDETPTSNVVSNAVSEVSNEIAKKVELEDQPKKKVVRKKKAPAEE